MNATITFNVLLIALLIGLAGTEQVHADEKQAGSEGTMQDDLELLRAYRTDTPASVETLAAAGRVFTNANLGGLTLEQVRERLGPPAKEENIGQRLVWTYAYTGGRTSVVRNVWFDFQKRVFGVETLPTA